MPHASRSGPGVFIGSLVVLLVLLLFYFQVGPFAGLGSLNPFVHMADSKANSEAEKDASGARAVLAGRRRAGEKGVLQLSGCVQEPDGWRIAKHAKVPDTIFVSVASYRDDECKDTVAAMFNSASNPDNLFIGVCQQNKEQEEDCFDKCDECAKRKQSGHIRVANFDYMSARGPTFARYQCSKLWRGEEFYFQIDSHLKFEQGWDETLKQQMRATKDKRAVVGAYPPTQQQLDEMKANNFTTMITMCPGKFEGSGMPSITARVVGTKGRTRPLPIAFQPAGMTCFYGTALYDVPYDPYLSYAFFNEEVLFSARLWTAGYNLYAPTKNFAVHHYGRNGKPKYWEDHKNSEACKKKANQRAKYLMGLIPEKQVHPDYFLDIGKYGMGKKRSLDEYLRFAGINMTTKTVTGKCPTP